MITESWASDDISDAELHLEGYTTIRRDRSTKAGGGCLIYHKVYLAVTQEDALNAHPTEAIWCRIKTKDAHLIIATCYNSPSSTNEQEEALHKNIREALAANSTVDVFITGDFNHRTIDWNTLNAQAEGRKFLELTQECFLTQHVDRPTRGVNILDLVLSNNHDAVENLRVVEPLSTSDHNIVLFDIVSSVKTTCWKEDYYDYRSGKYDDMREYLRSFDWYGIMEDKDTDYMWLFLKKTLDEAVGMFVPKRSRRGKHNRPMWWNKNIARARKAKTTWYNRYMKTNKQEDFENYKRTRNQATRLVRQAKRRLENRLAKNIKQDPKAFYKYARGKYRVKESIGTLMDEQGNSVNDAASTAEVFNSYFTSVFTEEDQEGLPEPRIVFDGDATDFLQQVDLTPATITKKLHKLKPEKAPGVDCIYPVVLKEMGVEIAIPLSLIFNSSLSTSTIPDDWTRANVTPIFKKGSKSNAGNYRPVSLTSHASKIMESLIKDSIMNHLTTHQLIRESQHGFTPKRSCLTNLLLFLDKVTKYIDESHPVDVLYLDFSKAFDKVPHLRLLKKLHAHGIGENISKWIEAWLCHREQRVTLAGTSSGWSAVTSGVPQGSVLGPTLFILYINDIDEGVSSHISKFADDTKLIRKVGTAGEALALQDDLNRLYEWSKDWQMLFNTAKCKCLHFGFNNPRHEYFLGGGLIASTMQEKDLGVNIHESLDVGHHCATAVKKANRMLGIIRRTYQDKSRENILPLYKSLVRPHLDYCVQAWRPHHQKDIDLIEGVQRRATKMIRGLEQEDYQTRLRSTKLTTLETRRLRADLIEVFKIFKGIDNIQPTELFDLGSVVTRGHRLKLFKRQCRLDSRKYFFSERIVDSWNRLPAKAIDADTVNTFKGHIDPILQQRGGEFTSQRRLRYPLPNSITSEYVFTR